MRPEEPRQGAIPPTLTPRPWLRPLLLLVAIAALMIVASTLGLGERIAALREWIGGLGAAGPFVFALVYAVAATLAIPASLLTVAAGAMFGSVVGVATVIAGATLGAAASFAIARWFARDAIAAWLGDNEKFCRLDSLTERPEPRARYHLVVLGAGTGGLVSAAVAAGLGARVALVERALMGGDCLNVGCVPSKAVIRAGRFVADARAAAAVGMAPADGAQPDFAAAMERMRAIRAAIGPHDSARRFRDEVGVDVFLGDGRFVAPDAAEVDGRRLRFRRAIVATGARAGAPPIPGLAEARLPHQRERLHAARAAGAARGGRRRSDRLRAGAGLRAARRRRDAARARRPACWCATTPRRARSSPRRSPATASSCASRPRSCASSAPAALTARGWRRRSGRRRWKSTPSWSPSAAGPTSRTSASRRQASPSASRASRSMPSCAPQIPASSPPATSLRNGSSPTHRLAIVEVPFAEVDRAQLEGETEGSVRIVVEAKTGAIRGATIVGRGAGELVSEVSTAMAGRLTLGRLANVIHPYPTRAEALRKAGDAWNRRRLTPGTKRWLARYLRLVR
jgi:hypothetical protein